LRTGDLKPANLGNGARRRGLREHVAKASCRLLGAAGPDIRWSVYFSEWGKIEDKQACFRLVWTQVVHWIAVLVAMNIMLLAGIQQLLPAPSTSLILPMLLALGCFLAGVNLASPRTLFSQADFGSRRAGGLVGQTIYALRHSRRSLRGRHWHDHLVKQKRK
jgi:hypothetical protein